MRTSNEDKYFYWLIDFVDMKGHRARNYIQVLQILYNAEFKVLIEMDDNRRQDGLYLRKTYMREEIPFKIKMEEAFRGHEYCSVLEVMIALSQRMENEFLHDPEIGDRTADWFWVMMRNLGLDEARNDEFDIQKAEEIVENFVLRRYLEDGTGSLFLTKQPQIDMKTVEIWVQMNVFIGDYLEEI